MPSSGSQQLLRAGLLEGVSILLASAPPPGPQAPLASAVAATCIELGARVRTIAIPAPAAEGESEGALENAVEAALPIDLLVVDAASVFLADATEEPARAGSALLTCMEASWRITHAIVNRAFLPREQGGRLLYLAPPSGACRSEGAEPGAAHADAARAGLENLARTLSIEWSRHGITAVAIAPGPGTAAGEVGALSAYLASPAGAYFSGCLLDLRGPAPRAPASSAG